MEGCSHLHCTERTTAPEAERSGGEVRVRPSILTELPWHEITTWQKAPAEAHKHIVSAQRVIYNEG